MADDRYLQTTPTEQPATERAPRATDATKDTVADHVLMGTGVGELARQLGYTPAGLRNLINSEDVQQRIASRRARLMEAGSRAYFRFLMNADRLAQDQLTEALDPGSHNQYRARTWILECIMPKRTASQADVNVSLAINHEVVVGLRDALTATAKVLDAEHIGYPVLLEGKKALPPIDG